MNPNEKHLSVEVTIRGSNHSGKTIVGMKIANLLRRLGITNIRTTGHEMREDDFAIKSAEADSIQLTLPENSSAFINEPHGIPGGPTYIHEYDGTGKHRLIRADRDGYPMQEGQWVAYVEPATLPTTQPNGLVAVTTEYYNGSAEFPKADTVYHVLTPHVQRLIVKLPPELEAAKAANTAG